MSTRKCALPIEQRSGSRRWQQHRGQRRRGGSSAERGAGGEPGRRRVRSRIPYALGLGSLLVLVTASEGARAQAVSDEASMSRHMRHYFRGELDLASAALGLGAGSGYIGGALLAKATDASRAAAVPILTVGLVELIIGVGLFARTGAQVSELDAQLRSDPDRYAREESERLRGVIARFGLFRTVEALLLVAGAGTAGLGAVLDEDRAIGAGLGVGVQAGVILVLDALAEARAERYLESIERFRVVPTVAPVEGGQFYGMALDCAF